MKIGQERAAEPRLRLGGRIGAILGAACIMGWPALYNGAPLLYPDSMSYLQAGPVVARGLLVHEFPRDYVGRSFIYSLGILPLHWNITMWPIVALNAVVTAYALWLTVRSLVPRKTVITYLALVVLLSIFTGLSWLVAWIMPDILGPVLYLSIYLLVFARDDISRTERGIIVAIAWWSAASHVTHLMVAAGICALLAIPPLFRCLWQPYRLRSVSSVAAIVFSVAIAHTALHWYLYGKPSLNGKHPPFLLARVIADGPGKLYLQRHCGDLRYEVCTHLRELPNYPGDFLWRERGIWLGSSEEQKERLLEEEPPIVASVVREYPREELMLSAHHFWEQLRTFGLWDYDADPWILEMADAVKPVTRTRYLQTRQAQETLDEDLFNSLQEWTVRISLAVIAAGLAFMRRWPRRVIGLTVIIAAAVLANAAVTGILSNVEDRYQARVIWLVPLLACVYLVNWRNSGAKRGEPGSTGAAAPLGGAA